MEALEEEKKRVKARLLSQGPGSKGCVVGTSSHGDGHGIRTISPHPAAVAIGGGGGGGGGSAVVANIGPIGGSAAGSAGGSGTGSMKVTHEIVRVDIRRQDAL